MSDRIKFTLLRLVPVVLICAAAAFWFNDVQDGGRYVVRNLLPLLILILLSAVTLYAGDGRWASGRGKGKQLSLGIAGFAIPALGLASYLHYAYSVNLNDMFSDATFPDGVFRYLPIYTIGAGAIGFAIGWLVGRRI